MDYAKPTLTDHGTLVDLTAACVSGQNGDSQFPSGLGFGLTFGKDVSNSITVCHSN